MLRVRRFASLRGFRLPTLPPVASRCPAADSKIKGNGRRCELGPRRAQRPSLRTTSDAVCRWCASPVKVALLSCSWVRRVSGCRLREALPTSLALLVRATLRWLGVAALAFPAHPPRSTLIRCPTAPSLRGRPTSLKLLPGGRYASGPRGRAAQAVSEVASASCGASRPRRRVHASRGRSTVDYGRGSSRCCQWSSADTVTLVDDASTIDGFSLGFCLSCTPVPRGGLFRRSWASAPG